MKKLLNDLLEYSRINRFEYANESLNLKEMATDIFNLIGNPSGFSCSTPDIELKIPKIPFEIVLRNLISNAIKHHDKNKGEIIINYEFLTGFHLISIKDDGPGIPSELQQKALEMFQTLKPRDTVEGSGMGLAIVSKIVAHYGGRVDIDSNASRGTKFIVQWPTDNVSSHGKKHGNPKV